MTNQSSTPDAGGRCTLPAAAVLAAAPQERLDGRLIAITGAAAGLGRAAAVALAAAGATTILVDRNLKGLESLHDAIVAAGHPQPVLHAMNFEGATINDYIEFATAIDGQFHRLDGLLHCAATLGELSPLSQYDADLWGRTLHVNLNAPFILNQVLLPLLDRSEAARLCFVTDELGAHPRAFWGAYAISKAALDSMMTMLSLELGERARVRVFGFDPGVVDTGLRRRAFPAEAAGTHPAPEDHAAVFVHLFGPAGHALHGQIACLPD